MPATAACVLPRSPVYRRRQPERTLLYRTVQTHLATWLALHDEGAIYSYPSRSSDPDAHVLGHGGPYRRDLAEN